MTKFYKHSCSKCSTAKLHPITCNLIQRLQCMKCKHIDNISFLLGSK